MILFVEPVGSTKPKFGTVVDREYTARDGSSFAVICPGQGFPVPLFRWAKSCLYFTGYRFLYYWEKVSNLFLSFDQNRSEAQFRHLFLRWKLKAGQCQENLWLFCVLPRGFLSHLSGKSRPDVLFIFLQAFTRMLFCCISEFWWLFVYFVQSQLVALYLLSCLKSKGRLERCSEKRLLFCALPRGSLSQHLGKKTGCFEFEAHSVTCSAFVQFYLLFKKKNRNWRAIQHPYCWYYKCLSISEARWTILLFQP